MKENQLEKERIKALSEILVAECKSLTYTLSSVEAIIDSGADVNYKNSRPIYFATKTHKFDLVRFLLKKGADSCGIAQSYIASMCDFKGFCDEMEPQFFEILDLVHSKNGDYMALFTPFINNMAVNGRLDKIQALIDRYYLTEREVASVIYIRIIFEIVNCGFEKMLAFIERHVKWIDLQTLDLAVSTNEWQVLEHILVNSNLKTPSENAVAQALFLGYYETLYILKRTGYDFKNKPLLLKKAYSAVKTRGNTPLEFLLNAGVKA